MSFSSTIILFCTDSQFLADGVVISCISTSSKVSCTFGNSSCFLYCATKCTCLQIVCCKMESGHEQEYRCTQILHSLHLIPQFSLRSLEG